jgi:alpha-ketoglutarate-dependent taurine dioxygenase
MKPEKYVLLAPRVSFRDIVQNGAYWRDELYKHKVLVFKDLHLTAQQFCDVHKAFGKPWVPPLYKLSHEISTVLPSGDCLTQYSNVLMKDSMGNGALRWHRDIPYHRMIRYPIRSLYPTVLPTQYQASTSFLDADVIWDRVSEQEAQELQRTDLIIQSWYGVVFNTDKVPRKNIPLVEEHPHTKRKSMLINVPGDRVWVQGMVRDGVELPSEYIHELFKIIDTPENVYEHFWELGDLVMFDNWSGVLHGRKELQTPEERAFWRMNVKHYWQA